MKYRIRPVDGRITAS